MRLGPERRSAVIEEKVKLATAYHEVSSDCTWLATMLTSSVGRAHTRGALHQRRYAAI